MPRPARSGSQKKTGKPPEPSRAPEVPDMAVRMLSGPKAGQVVRVSRERAVELCDGWTPQAELVSRNAVAARETRAA